MDKFHVPYLHNPGVLAGKLPEKLFKKIKKIVLSPEARKESSRHLLVGSIQNEFMTPRIPEFLDYLSEMYEHWRLIYETDTIDYKIEPIWTNYMRAHEFNPTHTHPDALAVFVLWVQIPYDVNEEVKAGGYNNPNDPSRRSCFEFTYARLDGQIKHNPIYVDKNYEGTIVMFPGYLNHTVYPFCTSDGERISIAGNIYPKK